MPELAESNVRALPEKLAIVDSTQLSYLEFRRSLKPAYGRLWCALAAINLGLIAAILVPLLFVERVGMATGIALVASLALVIGFLQYLLSLLGHASGHGDLAPDRQVNDALANALIFPITGLSVSEYRRVHFAHHRLLGRAGDPEDGYREPLDLMFLVRSVTGMRTVNAVLRHAGGAVESADESASGLRKTGLVTPSRVVALCIHITAIVLPALHGAWFCSVAWMLAFGIVMPSLTALRLVLEHRPSPSDIALLEGDAVTRCFRGGWFTSLFGAAGFRSHLIHHWDPQIHCTRLRDVERYLQTTGAAEALRAAMSTYPRTFAQLAGS